MDTRHRNPAGALLTHCADEDHCELFSCEVCLKEVPADAIKVVDAQDYVHHFCGLDCFETWQKQAGDHSSAKPAGASDRLK
jgi:hypothetical protein